MTISHVASARGRSQGSVMSPTLSTLADVLHEEAPFCLLRSIQEQV
jgi:hypothetical protein